MGSICSWSCKVLQKGLMLCGTLAIDGWLLYTYCVEFTNYQLEEEDANVTEIYVKLAIVAFFGLMVNLCLLRLFCSNPGFVNDYFKSRKLQDVSADYQRFEVYRKEDFPEEDSFQEHKPIATV